MKAPVNVSRRHFLTVLGLSTAGLCLGVHASQPTNEIMGDTDPKPKTSNQSEQDKNAGLAPNVFIHIASSGLVSIICHRSEMGQGIRSTLPVLIADELGADMKNVKVIQAEGDKKYGDQNTDGSSSIRGKFELMRKAAATARMMLLEAASQKWKVSVSKLTTEKGYVVQKGTKKKLSFGELAVAAGALDVPKAESVILRPRRELKNLGKDLPLLDGHDYVTGKAVFGADVKLPDMLIAVIARPTVVGAKIKSLKDDEAKKVSGVKKIIRMPEPKAPYAFQPWGGVAVLATHTWAAITARDALEIKWDQGPNASYESVKFRETLFKSAEKGGTTYRKKGNVDEALKASAKTLEAQYYVPHIPHMPMETPVAIAHYKKEDGGSVEVWAATQNPQAARTEVARVLGLSEDKVRINVTLLGGGFGRKSKADFCSEAAWLSKEAGVPVRVQFTREDDVHNDYLNTVGAQIFKAGIDKEGKVTAFKWRTAFPPIPSLFNASVKEATPRELQQGVLDIALDIPNLEAEACEAVSHIRTGWLRSVYNIFHAFGASCFLDEIAHETKVDPVVFLNKIYANRVMDLNDLGVEALYNYGLPLEQYPVDGKRLLGVLNQVAKMSNWQNRGKIKDRGFGIAVHRSFSSYVGVVASVMKDKSGKIKVDEVWISIDAGTVVNTDRVRAQMEGSVINGMTYFFHGGVTHKEGAVVESSFDDAQIMRMSDIPKKIHVDIVKSEGLPGGVGEPGLPPVAPAIGNAIFALTGKRIREFASKELSSSVG